jgi:glycosyltransferase involved in cell wall biosynthesis
MNVFPLVSIIMPTYNRADFILETINSIRNQTYENWELLILDDGSMDDTEAVINHIHDDRIQYIKLQHTGITGKLKNEGIRKAKGELIALMDADDLWPEHKLETQAHELLQNPEAGFSFTNGFDFIERDVPLKYFFKRKEGVVCSHVFISFCKGEFGIRTPTVIFHKRCVEISGFFNENRAFTDFSFFGNLCYLFKAVILYEPLLKRRLHATNNTSANWEADYAEHFETIQLYKRQKRITAGFARKVLFMPYINRGEQYLGIKKRYLAFHSFFKAWTCRPWSLIAIKKLAKTVVHSLR